jgi:hypothetical protein
VCHAAPIRRDSPSSLPSTHPETLAYVEKYAGTHGWQLRNLSANWSLSVGVRLGREWPRWENVKKCGVVSEFEGAALAPLRAPPAKDDMCSVLRDSFGVGVEGVNEVVGRATVCRIMLPTMGGEPKRMLWAPMEMLTEAFMNTGVNTGMHPDVTVVLLHPEWDIHLRQLCTMNEDRNIVAIGRRVDVERYVAVMRGMDPVLRNCKWNTSNDGNFPTVNADERLRDRIARVIPFFCKAFDLGILGLDDLGVFRDQDNTHQKSYPNTSPNFGATHTRSLGTKVELCLGFLPSSAKDSDLLDSLPNMINWDTPKWNWGFLGVFIIEAFGYDATKHPTDPCADLGGMLLFVPTQPARQGSHGTQWDHEAWETDWIGEFLAPLHVHTTWWTAFTHCLPWRRPDSGKVKSYQKLLSSCSFACATHLSEPNPPPDADDFRSLIRHEDRITESSLRRSPKTPEEVAKEKETRAAEKAAEKADAIRLRSRGRLDDEPEGGAGTTSVPEKTAPAKRGPKQKTSAGKSPRPQSDPKSPEESAATTPKRQKTASTQDGAVGADTSALAFTQSRAPGQTQLSLTRAAPTSTSTIVTRSSAQGAGAQLPPDEDMPPIPPFDDGAHRPDAEDPPEEQADES